MKEKYRYELPSFDFASLYPSVMKRYNLTPEIPEKVLKRKLRKKKLERILNQQENGN